MKYEPQIRRKINDYLIHLSLVSLIRIAKQMVDIHNVVLSEYHEIMKMTVISQLINHQSE
jgi:hypothetical protein